MRILQKLSQGAERGKLDLRGRRHAPAHAGRPLEHPRRNFQPPAGHLTGQTAAENRHITLLDYFVDMDLQPRPWMPWVAELAFNSGPVGVQLSSCTIPSGRTHRSHTNRQHRRPSSCLHHRTDRHRQLHKQWSTNQSCTKTETGPPHRGRPPCANSVGSNGA